MKEKNFNIISDYDNVAEVIQDIKKYLAGENLEEHLCNAVDICLTEALNNVIKHSYGGNNSQPIEINVKKDLKHLEIEIVDVGLPRENLVIKDLEFDPNDIENLPESGMGLFIIKQLMDELDYGSKEGKNYFILKKWLI
ncbi:MAG: ATP-binding protein [Ignavibacteriales bacterium]|nr:ATP-binding protein [Ignavibacteriales bacterium]